MVTVIENWLLKPEFSEQALELMQEMDDIVGPNAHDDPGWCEHGRFYQLQSRPAEVWMMYTWRSREAHEVFIKKEEELLTDFYERFCERPRQIIYFTELPVDVEAGVDQHGDASHG
ncbi:hypothetical protein [Streptomyces sp. DSM 40750]|uniref:hypothetical protein n=1 Tax=Streptomyces sp. DSM 40750 TaxID=2801030 RepID=UPI00214A9456|nr:hypothetical protein [Streptomyces sp. DSM 40750]UUU25954.1 hypothetical protein JIX55_40180 [Streptomyces sp. DSM 40750]